MQKASEDHERETAEWNRVKDLADPEALQDFIDRHPNSPHAVEAAQKIVAAQQAAEAKRSEKAWDQVKSSGDVDALQNFRYRYPNSPHAAEADDKIVAAQQAIEAQRSEKQWDQVKNSGDVAALQSFRARFPGSPHAAEADQRIAALSGPTMHGPNDQQLEEADWDSVKGSTDPEELKAFVHFFPKSTHVAEANRMIAELEKKREQAQRLAKDAEAAKQVADNAKSAEEKCNRESAEVARIAQSRSADALRAIKSRSPEVCPRANDAIDVALNDIRAQDCKVERDRVGKLGDLEGLRSAASSLTCDDAAADVRTKIARLEQEAAQAAKVCDDAKTQVDTKIDASEVGAREKLEKFATRTDCPDARDEAKGKIEEIDARVISAQVLLAKFGCYTVKPASGRFDQPTEDAIARFESGARF